MVNERLVKEVEESVLGDVFENDFPLGTNNPVFSCHMGNSCRIPDKNGGDIYLKIINTDGSSSRDPIIVELPIG